MIRFEPSIADDLPRIAEWIDADGDHRGRMEPNWWLEGTVLSCCAKDDNGPVMYLRMDREGDRARMHIQFAPEKQVSKMRVASAIIDGIPRMVETMANFGFKALVFDSISSPLINFMTKKMGFIWAGGDDYLRPF